MKIENKLASWEATLVPLERSWLPPSENPDYHRQKTNRSARRRFWRYRFSAVVWNCQILNQVVESHLFTSLWNKYHQWLSNIELIQTSDFSSFLFKNYSLFHCWKANRDLELSRNSQTPEDDHLRIYSLWSWEGGRKMQWGFDLITVEVGAAVRSRGTLPYFLLIDWI
jgi:hypothetical protein